ncbi:MAG: patatin-like phospholipase family protein [Marmoricola sp.]
MAHRWTSRVARIGSASSGPEPTRDVLVLSGGGNRGPVQVGMLQVLLAAGIRPVGYVGCSVGALNAAFLAGATSADDARDRVSALADRWCALRTREVFPGGTLSRVGHVARRHGHLYSPGGLAELVRAWAPAERLEDLPTPLRVVTTRLDTGEAVYHSSGPLQRLLLASAALPAIFPPVSLPDEERTAVLHVDGGVADLVPVVGAVELAPTRVWVLDASVPARLRDLTNPVGVLVASLEAAMRSRPLAPLGPGIAVHHLRCPDLGARLLDFSRTAEHLALGRRAAEQALAARAA